MKVSYAPKDRFCRWASSMSGISGGNPKADLWFCGIEYGGDYDIEDILKNRYKNIDLKAGIPSWSDAFIEQMGDECTMWPYVQKIAKLVCFYENIPAHNYKQYILERLCRADAETFLLNLYPLNFPSTDHHYWTKKHFDFTGFPNKLSYIAWCMQYRFPVLQELVVKHQPRALICNGIKLLDDFKLAFLGKERVFEEGKAIELPSGKACKIFGLNGDKTNLIIAPFFGRGGLMSDADLKALAAIAKRNK